MCVIIDKVICLSTTPISPKYALLYFSEVASRMDLKISSSLVCCYFVVNRSQRALIIGLHGSAVKVSGSET